MTQTVNVALTLFDSTLQKIRTEAARRGVDPSEIMSEALTIGAASLSAESPSAPAPPARTFFTVAEAAERLGMKDATIAAHCKAGKIRATKIGAAWRITPADLAAYEQGEIRRRNDSKQG